MEERSGHIHSMNTLVSITAYSRLTKKKNKKKDRIIWDAGC